MDTAQRRSLSEHTLSSCCLGEGEPGLSPLNTPLVGGSHGHGGGHSIPGADPRSTFWASGLWPGTGVGQASLAGKALLTHPLVAGWGGSWASLPQAHGGALGEPGPEARWSSLASQDLLPPGGCLELPTVPWCVHSPGRARVRLQKKTQPLRSPELPRPTLRCSLQQTRPAAFTDGGGWGRHSRNLPYHNHKRRDYSRRTRGN